MRRTEEQTLMRSLKSCGGLTRGRKFDHVQQNLFVFSQCLCAEVNEAIEKLDKAKYCQSEQHKRETGQSRVRRETDDCQKVE